jgi:hypothetical protein
MSPAPEDQAVTKHERHDQLGDTRASGLDQPPRNPPTNQAECRSRFGDSDGTNQALAAGDRAAAGVQFLSVNGGYLHEYDC